MNNLEHVLTKTGCPGPMLALGAAKRSILAPPVKGLWRTLASQWPAILRSVLTLPLSPRSIF
jgi:hypothetical protein